METAHLPGTQFSPADDDVEDRAELGEVGRPELIADSMLSPASSLMDAVFSSTNTCHCREAARRSMKSTAKTGGRGRGPQEGLPCPRSGHPKHREPPGDS